MRARPLVTQRLTSEPAWEPGPLADVQLPSSPWTHPVSPPILDSAVRQGLRGVTGAQRGDKQGAVVPRGQKSFAWGHAGGCPGLPFKPRASLWVLLGHPENTNRSPGVTEETAVVLTLEGHGHRGRTELEAVRVVILLSGERGKSGKVSSKRGYSGRLGGSVS